MDDKTLPSIFPRTFKGTPEPFSRVGWRAFSDEKRSGTGKRLFAAILVIAGLALALPALAGPVKPGHSAMWYDPARDGEGWVLEVLADDRALLYWVTYDEDGSQRWLQAEGNIVEGEAGQEIRFPELLVTRGASFGPGFDPDDVEVRDVGEATMRFADCDHGTFSYSAFGQSQTIEVQRLSQTMAAGCQPINGVPGEPIKAYAGESGSWFDVSHDGEGYSLHWLSRDEALLTWYTYDAEGNQFWLIAVGRHEGGKIVFNNLMSTRGARFGEAFDPEDVEYVDWGSLLIDLQCTKGTASYESDLSAFGSGSFELTRLTYIKNLDCPWERPKLWELYDITWKEIPIAKGDPMDTNNIQADSIADNGKVAARRLKPSPEIGANVVIWDPLQAEWSELPGTVANTPLFISLDGNSIFATESFDDSESPIDPLMWTESTGWEPLSGLIFDRNFITSVSQDFSHVTGRGKRLGNRERPWVWNAQTGQQQLDEPADYVRSIPTASANGGNTVVGVALSEPPSGSSFPGQTGLLWRQGKGVEILDNHHDTFLGAAVGCSRDCSLIFGVGQAEPDPKDPNMGQAWYWRQSGEFGYLGIPDDVLIGNSPFSIADVSADGSLVVGSYLTTFSRSDGGSETVTSRAFLWTQRTGLVSIRSIVDTVEIGDDQWQNMDGVSLSSNGRKILLRGAFITDALAIRHSRAAVLELEPKE